MVARFQSGRGGFVLVVLLVATIVLQLSYLTMFRLTSMVKKRSDEAELRYRLFAYKRAIDRYHRYFRRYPSRLEDLLTLPPNPRMLRKLYSDPMSKDGKWKIIHWSDGILIKEVRSNSSELGTNGVPYSKWRYNSRGEFIVESVEREKK
jgi:type II secretory pathway pseudopilin PulG